METIYVSLKQDFAKARDLAVEGSDKWIIYDTLARGAIETGSGKGLEFIEQCNKFYKELELLNLSVQKMHEGKEIRYYREEDYVKMLLRYKQLASSPFTSQPIFSSLKESNQMLTQNIDYLKNKHLVALGFDDHHLVPYTWPRGKGRAAARPKSPEARPKSPVRGPVGSSRVVDLNEQVAQAKGEVDKLKIEFYHAKQDVTRAAETLERKRDAGHITDEAVRLAADKLEEAVKRQFTVGGQLDAATLKYDDLRAKLSDAKLLQANADKEKMDAIAKRLEAARAAVKVDDFKREENRRALDYARFLRGK